MMEHKHQEVEGSPGLCDSHSNSERGGMESPRKIMVIEPGRACPLSSVLEAVYLPCRIAQLSQVPISLKMLSSLPTPRNIGKLLSPFVFLHIIKARGISSLIDNGPQLRLAKAILFDVLAPYFRIILFP